MMLAQLKQDLLALANAEKAAFFPRFFKTGPGQYGEGDEFIGVTVPNQRLVAKKYRHLNFSDVEKLLHSKIHEHRLTALFILVHQYQKADKEGKKQIYDFYFNHRSQVNNWDLVDSSVHKIMGDFLIERDRKVLYQLARSTSLWHRRMAMVSCFAFIADEDFLDALAIAEILLHDSHDLIHKAVGWVLREIGKKDVAVLEAFLEKHAHHMPRTMLRYAIERLNPAKKKHFMLMKGPKTRN